MTKVRFLSFGVTTLITLFTILLQGQYLYGDSQNITGILPKELKNLTSAEKRLISTIEEGEIADFSSSVPQENDPATASSWGNNRRVRAKLVSWLSSNSDALRLVSSEGIRIKGAAITGRLDFSASDLPKPLKITYCAIEDGIVLSHATTKSIWFSGSRTSFLMAGGLTVNGSLSLNAGFSTTDKVNPASIEFINNMDVNQLDAPETGNFHAGEVNLKGASIRGPLDCSGGMFTSPAGIVLNLTGIRVTGSLNFIKAIVKGKILLSGGSIEGDLNCDSARFENLQSKGASLDAYNVSINGSAFFDHGFYSLGQVRLHGATIRGDLVCGASEFAATSDVALYAERMRVDRSLYFKKDCKIKGILDLAQSHVGSLADDSSSWPGKGKLVLDGFVYGGFIEKETPRSAQGRLEWLRCQQYSSKQFNPQPYEQLARVLRNAGLESDAQEILIYREKDLTQFGELNWLTKVWRKTLEYLFDYGYRPEKVFIYIAFFVVLGSVIFWQAKRKDIMIPTKDDLNKDYPRFNPFVYSLETFVPLVDFYHQKYWIPGKSRRNWVWIYLWFHIAMGWILSTLAVAGLTGLIRKGFE